MFRRIDGLPAAAVVMLQVDGLPVAARAGDSVALALLNGGVDTFRNTPVSGQPRAPLCLMGTCFDCLVQIDGQPNQQACMVPVRDGMQVRRTPGARTVEPQ